ncbi:MAG TPA: hypothetical protein VLV78_06480 [Thermoanaerobaculia bacterium]|nr:hypothetical protein [Thermoanaerobaculia bacterium]
MPKQKDLKRIVRSRMQKTGESYTTARLQLLKKKDTPLDYGALAGMSDTAVEQKTGRGWAAWLDVLDAIGAAGKPHREIARYVSSLGVPSWWSQTVTVGYERIRGLRAIGQKRDGRYEANKSMTFPVPVDRLFKAFADARMRARWLPTKITVRTAKPNKTMRITWDDKTTVLIGFMAKSAARSSVAVQHMKLPDKAAADRMKALWTERLEALNHMLA